MRYAVGIDVGGTNTRVALINQDYHIVQREQFPTDKGEAAETICRIKSVVDRFQVKVEGVGISCPGPLDLMAGTVMTPPNLPGWHYYPIEKKLGKALGVPVYLENDANLACLAEAAVGAGKNSRYVQFLTVSTGIGAGFCIDRKIYHGSRGFAQEVANSILWRDGPFQGDLKKGSVESVSSGTAIVRRAEEAGLSVKHAGEVYQLAGKGNTAAKEIMEDAYEFLSNFIGILYGVLDPDLFVLGGSVALKIPGFIKEIQRRAEEKVYTALRDNIRIVPAQLGEDCGLVGAAYLAFHTPE
ncbi:ROK family protein [Anaerostipes sp.]|uniref:ROK family protein n=1 Tax=Anaerostipes sp. TaxID=1872530 RepID=UPI0025C03A20|nr:ROK family protein [Anaerostipes sp.]MBS7007672.1 ROK family protein [Anaerostipes sp.]